MTTATLTLTGFLLARIAEDEDEARDATDLIAEGAAYRVRVATLYVVEPELATVRSGLPLKVRPARVLAECEAKRQIVEMLSAPLFTDEGVPFGEGGFGEAYAEALAHLAVVYADHEAYREEWRP